MNRSKPPLLIHKQLPVPLLFLYAGRQPLHEVLPGAEHLGTGEVIGRQCDLFLFPQVRWAVTQDQVFSLDRATSIPLKVESFRDKAARDKNEPMWVWTAESLDEVQGHFVTMKSTQILFSKDRAPSMTWKYTVESIEFDKAYPASTFSPTFQPGVTIFDAVTEKVSQAPGAKEVISGAKKEVATTAQPIQATQQSGWSTYVPSITLGLGCAVLLAAGIMWWRHR